MNHQHDFVIIGGGPAGATAAAILAEAGKSVLVLEAAKFPRFAVGEIVAPTALWRVWSRLGITEEMLDSKFVRKWAGGWQAPDGTLFRFDQDVHPGDCRCRAFVYNLERSVYDEYLFNLAQEKGATALQEAYVDDLIFNDEGRLVGLKYQHGGSTHEVSCSWVIDASGRTNVLARKLGLRMELEEMNSFSAFAHFEGAKRETGQKEGEIRIIFDKDMWWWFAPLTAPKTSVGVVANRKSKHWDDYLADPEKFFDKSVQLCPFVWERIRDAKRITGFKQVAKGSTGTSTLDGYHYATKQFVGNGWALVGDAGGFVDPIFSAGLFVAQTTAQWLAEEILAAQAEGNLTAERLAPYEERYHNEIGQVMKFIRRYATDYFNPEFVNFYLGMGARNEKIRQLYIRTFIGYDLEAIEEYNRLVEKLIRRVQGAAKASAEKASADIAPAAQ